jgi:hypothetical protein
MNFAYYTYSLKFSGNANPSMLQANVDDDSIFVGQIKP